MKYSWILLFKLPKNSTHLFHYSSFWNRCLYIGSRYYFMMIRLSWFCSCWYLYFMRFVFGYYEIKLFKTTVKSIVMIFSMLLMFLKSIDMFLKCSWIVLEFSLQKSLATLEKITKIWISQEQKWLLWLNRITFFIIFEGLSFSEKIKMRKTGNSGHI